MPVSESTVLSLPKDVGLHPEMPLVPLLGLMHLRVPLLGTVLGGRRRLDEDGVHDGSLPQPQPLAFQVGVDFPQETLPQVVLLQQVAEVEDGGLVGQGAGELQPHEPPDRVGLVEQSLPPRRRGSSMPGSLRL